MTDPKKSPKAGLYLFAGMGIALSTAVRSHPEMDAVVSKLIFGLVVGALILISSRSVMKPRSGTDAVFHQTGGRCEDTIKPTLKPFLSVVLGFVSLGILLTSGLMFSLSFLAVLISFGKHDSGAWFGFMGLVFFGLCTFSLAKRIKSM